MKKIVFLGFFLIGAQTTDASWLMKMKYFFYKHVQIPGTLLGLKMISEYAPGDENSSQYVSFSSPLFNEKLKFMLLKKFPPSYELFEWIKKNPGDATLKRFNVFEKSNDRWLHQGYIEKFNIHLIKAIKLNDCFQKHNIKHFKVTKRYTCNVNGYGLIFADSVTQDDFAPLLTLEQVKELETIGADTRYSDFTVSDYNRLEPGMKIRPNLIKNNGQYHIIYTDYSRFNGDETACLKHLAYQSIDFMTPEAKEYVMEKLKQNHPAYYNKLIKKIKKSNDSKQS